MIKRVLLHEHLKAFGDGQDFVAKSTSTKRPGGTATASPRRWCGRCVRRAHLKQLVELSQAFAWAHMGNARRFSG